MLSQVQGVALLLPLTVDTEVSFTHLALGVYQSMLYSSFPLLCGIITKDLELSLSEDAQGLVLQGNDHLTKLLNISA